jgi:hypothetical protein
MHEIPASPSLLLADPIHLFRRLIRHGLAPLRDPPPASQLTWRSARKEWKVLSFSMPCNLLLLG